MRAQVVTVSCDFCGYGGALSRPEDFTQHAGASYAAGPTRIYDLCRWCAAPKQLRAVESGGHLITFTEAGWGCSCGEQWRRPLFPFGVEAAVPHLPNAAAHRHLDNTWRKS